MQLLQYFKELSLHPKNAKELKGLILQLAVQGKLTANWRLENPDVEPASVLLERVQEEKARLIRKGRIKKEKDLADIKQENIPLDLPHSWFWVKLGEIGLINPRNNVEDSLKIGFIPMKSISQNYSTTPDFEIRTWASVKKSFTHLREDDIAFAKITPCFENSKACIFKGLPNGYGAGTTELHVFRRINKDILPEFIYCIFKSPIFLQKGEVKMTGSAGQKRVPRDYFFNYIIGLPPLEEQKAIVKMVNQLFAEVEQLEALTQERIQLKENFVTSALQHLSTGNTEKEWAFLREHFSGMVTEKSNIKKLRETVLQLAVQGKLTAHWRKENPEVEPASVLLERIQEEKAQLIKKGKIKKEKPLPEIKEEEIPCELPQGWVWCRFQKVIINIEAGKSPTCFPKRADEGEWGVIKMSAISWGKFNSNENKALPYAAEIFSDKEIKPGDFILTRANTNELIAKSVIVPTNVRAKLLLNDKTLRFKFYDCIDHEYINLYNNGSHARKHYKKVSSGTSDSMQNISRDNIKLLILPLPPLDEQKAIVAKVNALMGLCDLLEQRIDQSQTQVERLMQSCLREVFEVKEVRDFQTLI